jgi:hypothetical protein
MTTTKPNPMVRVLPSLTDLAFLLPLIFLFGRGPGAKQLLADGDTGWHIRAGQWMLANHQVPRQDLFSFTRAGAPWFAWEWLWDVIFGWLHQNWGMAAVILGSLLVLLFTSALVFRLIRRKCQNVLLAIGFTVLAVAGSSIHWLARPHLFTMLFVLIFYWILEETSTRMSRLQAGLPAPRLPWLLPLLTVLWTNLHAGFLAGIIVICCYALGDLATWLTAAEAEQRKAALRSARNYLLAAAGCFLASFVNPYFYHLHQHIFQYLTDGYQFKNIGEFQSLSFHDRTAMYFEPMIFLAVIAVAWSLFNRRFAYVFLIGAWLHLALLAARNIPLFMFVAGPPVALTVHEVLQRISQADVASWLRNAIRSFERLAADVDATDRIGRAHLASVFVVLVFALLFYAPGRPPKFQAEYDAKAFPAAALDALHNSNPSARIFTLDDWGGYMIYRYPGNKVFIDGRSDFYGDKLGQKFIDTMNGRYDWEGTLRKYNIDIVLLPTGASLASTLKESERWRPIYDDGMAIAFRSADATLARANAGSETSSPVLSSSGKSRDRNIADSESQQNPRRRPI